jgi:hypothetical protein
MLSRMNVKEGVILHMHMNSKKSKRPYVLRKERYMEENESNFLKAYHGKPTSTYHVLSPLTQPNNYRFYHSTSIKINRFNHLSLCPEAIHTLCKSAKTIPFRLRS